ncbi:MAG: hypothetical protein [Caudoviricetes sp.]|nr:MAG: hypothetical protein [Caudoviricetes sp.]
MKKFLVFKWYPLEDFIIDYCELNSEEEADALCNSLEKGRAPGKPYYYRYRVIK